MLSRKGVAIEEKDFFKDRFSEPELRGVLRGRSPRDVFSWRSPSFKALGLDPSGISEDEMVRLMLEQPRLIRRPMVEVGDELIIGADQKALDRVLGM